MSQTKQEQREQLRDSIVLLLVRSPGLTVAQIIDEIVAAGVVPRTSSTERRTRAMLNNMLASGIITKTGHPHRYTATPANAKDLQRRAIAEAHATMCEIVTGPHWSEVPRAVQLLAIKVLGQLESGDPSLAGGEPCEG